MRHEQLIGDSMPEDRVDNTDKHLLDEHSDVSKPHSGKIRKCVENLSQNPGAEIVRYGRRKANILSLGQGEGDAATPDFILKGAQKAMDDGRTFYGPVLGQDPLRQEISNY